MSIKRRKASSTSFASWKFFSCRQQSIASVYEYDIPNKLSPHAHATQIRKADNISRKKAARQKLVSIRQPTNDVKLPFFCGN